MNNMFDELINNNTTSKLSTAFIKWLDSNGYDRPTYDMLFSLETDNDPYMCNIIYQKEDGSDRMNAWGEGNSEEEALSTALDNLVCHSFTKDKFKEYLLEGYQS